ncbi:hypothetical protein [Vibrio europaeus]|uniref:hypothetical protein n=1 Tax=Vibrio europaeus TaxID=300876 RepID=UPI00233EBCDC|nr:hypothetical protein [Vibrio europaeus]MDC5753547.1 hypothetical protein [Vibrio europaeus]MDC5816541.1 hypothetical protein [Vibrio europaeus]
MLKTQILTQTQTPGKASLLYALRPSKEQADYAQGISARSAELNKKILGKVTYADLSEPFCIKGAQSPQTLDQLFENIRNNIH